MPDPIKLVNTLRQAVQAFRATPGRAGRFVQLAAGCEVLVVGDLHGNLENFRLALRRADLAQHPQRHFVVQELVHGPFFYPGGGDKSHQLLDLIAALKCQYPARVHYLLGNHELAQWQNQLIGKGGVDQNELFLAGVRHAYGPQADAVYAEYLELFKVADLVLRTENRVIMSHTLPAARYMASWDSARLREEELRPEDLQLGGWLHSLVWGRDDSAANVHAFLAKLEGDLLVSGHLPCEQGYDAPNDAQVILDALGTPACCCLFSGSGLVTQQDLLSGVGVL